MNKVINLIKRRDLGSHIVKLWCAFNNNFVSLKMIYLDSRTFCAL